jgi:hypothetical protein
MTLQVTKLSLPQTGHLFQSFSHLTAQLPACCLIVVTAMLLLLLASGRSRRAIGKTEISPITQVGNGWSLEPTDKVD